MQYGRFLPADVPHLDPNRRQDVRDEPPVAAPPEEFGAHDGGPQSLEGRQQLEQPVGEFITLDVICVGAKSGGTPGRVRQCAGRPAPSAERGDPVVADAILCEMALERWC